jgi:hypothetical protein
MVEVKHANRLCGCDPFILAHQVEQVYYMLYPCEKLSPWWVVYRVNPCDCTPLTILVIMKIKVVVGEFDEFYQDDELSCSFNIDPDLALNFLLVDANDITVPEQRKQVLRKKET